MGLSFHHEELLLLLLLAMMMTAVRMREQAYSEHDVPTREEREQAYSRTELLGGWRAPTHARGGCVIHVTAGCVICSPQIANVLQRP